MSDQYEDTQIIPHLEEIAEADPELGLILNELDGKEASTEERKNLSGINTEAKVNLAQLRPAKRTRLALDTIDLLQTTETVSGAIKYVSTTPYGEVSTPMKLIQGLNQVSGLPRHDDES
ncbi:MAG: hypothetical protein Q9M91_04065 [Candidatus Dojkabacteria bacterium]|nr:hypothetical protein [Candidatus Dojkabacteria bacterium]MDQ7020989.1 hypothetical protein [Candidatus Dojkabacteria bacterium]